MVAAAAALGVWLVCRWGRRWIGRHRRRALHLGWLGVLAAAGATIGYGLARDALPGWSLTFRWQYWTVSAAMIADHPLGVGRENFGRHYLRYKPIEYPEEVTNPHDLFVQAAAEWGWLGLAGLCGMLYGASRRIVLGGPAEGVEGDEERQRLGRFLRWGGMAALSVVMFLRIPLLESRDVHFVYYVTVASGLVFALMYALTAAAMLEGSMQAEPKRHAEPWLRAACAFGLLAFLIHDTINFALFVPGTLTTCAAVFALAVSMSGETSKENGEERAVACGHDSGREGPLPHLSACGHACLCVARRQAQAGGRGSVDPGRGRARHGRELLRHRFPPLPYGRGSVSGRGSVRGPLPHGRGSVGGRGSAGGRGSVSGGGSVEGNPRGHLGVAVRGWRRWGPVGGCAAAVAVVIWAGLRPQLQVQRALQRAEADAGEITAGPVRSQSAARWFEKAIEADPLDPSPPLRYAEWLVGLTATPELSEEAWREAEGALEEAVRRDPDFVSLLRRRRGFYLMRAQARKDSSDALKAVDAALRVLDCYPQSPPDLAALGDCRLRAAKMLRASEEGGASAEKVRSLLEGAIEAYRRALELDRQRIEWERFHRLDARTVRRIEERMAEAKGLLGT
ncbi:MAG: hypothetical protein D6788_06175 [Planctomycetota bacterium]|nr:MAG: hypothetical protein D6788_06175 [Planctomycetota bacterium]